MNTFLNFFKQHAWKVATIAFLLLFLAKGCTNNKISNLEKQYQKNTDALCKKVDSLSSIVSKMASEKQVRDQMERTMLDFLIYEDDLDKGKTSLSQVKNKIEQND